MDHIVTLESIHNSIRALTATLDENLESREGYTLSFSMTALSALKTVFRNLYF